jgi:hypothetical protein
LVRACAQDLLGGGAGGPGSEPESRSLAATVNSSSCRPVGEVTDGSGWGLRCRDGETFVPGDCPGYPAKNVVVDYLSPDDPGRPGSWRQEQQRNERAPF